MIKELTKNELHVIDAKADQENQVLEAMKIADVVILRQGAERGMRVIKKKFPEVKTKWVLDIDDNIEMISPYSEHYSEYGTEEFYDKNSKMMIWEDGKNFDIAHNRLRVESLLKGLGEVDLVTVTTKKLADYASKYSNNVAVLPNCIDLKRWWKQDLKPNKQLRVGWSGGVSHYEDWWAIKRPLNRLMKEFEFKLVMVGAHFSGLIDKENRHLVEVEDWLPFKGHSYRMMCMDLDVAIIPLADLPFNNYKSSVKWYEMSAMGVPSVVSKITPYKEDFEEGKTALGYNSPKEFEHALRKLLTKPQTRKKIGFNARKWVERNRDARKCAKMWTDAYKSIL
jgi:glycosyltransferase involved in cell wall biosynthesis